MRLYTISYFNITPYIGLDVNTIMYQNIAIENLLWVYAIISYQ